MHKNPKILLKQVAGLEICLLTIINHTFTSRIVEDFISLVAAMLLNCYCVYLPLASQIVTVKAVLPLYLLDSQFILIRESHTTLGVS